MRIREAVALSLVALSVSFALAPGAARAAHCSARGATYRQALAARAAASSAASVGESPAQLLIERRTRYYCRLHGRRVGRWFGLVYAYWPRPEWDRAMLCIRRESRGDPDALGDAGEIGLFQLLGYQCRPWRPETNVRLAAKRWREDGWRPWTTMREYW